MPERSHLTNGRFAHNLNGWTPSSASYSAGNGDDHIGVASLPAGASIAQPFSVDRARAYTLHVAAYGGNATIALVDGEGNALASVTATGSAGVWTESALTLGLLPGTSYTITLTNGGGSTILLDDIWLWWCPKTRAQLAAIVARTLGTLATEASLSTSSSGAQTEGDYTDAVDAGLRAVGAINEETDLPDIRYLTTSLVDSCLAAIEQAMLGRLANSYTAQVDTKAGPLEQKLSQIGAALRASTGKGGSSKGGAVVMRKLGRSAEDYELGG